MDDYTKAMRIQELREQRVDLMWQYITSEISAHEFNSEPKDHKATVSIYQQIRELDKQIKDLQNG